MSERDGAKVSGNIYDEITGDARGQFPWLTFGFLKGIFSVFHFKRRGKLALTRLGGLSGSDLQERFTGMCISRVLFASDGA